VSSVSLVARGRLTVREVRSRRVVVVVRMVSHAGLRLSACER
jgi:hypothetical protein